MSLLDLRRLAFLGFLAPLLAGCLQPMYGGPTGAALRDTLMAIAIDPIPDRVGHYLENNLVLQLNGTGSRPVPRYHLAITVHERLTTPLVDTVTGQATSATLVVDADYRLVPVGSLQPITEGTAFTTVAYDRFSQTFANISAASNAEIRATEVLADQIRTRLAIALTPKG